MQYSTPVGTTTPNAIRQVLDHYTTLKIGRPYSPDLVYSFAPTGAPSFDERISTYEGYFFIGEDRIKFAYFNGSRCLLIGSGLANYFLVGVSDA